MSLLFCYLFNFILFHIPLLSALYLYSLYKSGGFTLARPSCNSAPCQLDRGCSNNPTNSSQNHSLHSIKIAIQISKTIIFLDNDLDQKYPAGWRPAPTWAELRPWLPSESPPPLLNTPTSRTPCPPEPVFSLGYLVTVTVFIG